MRRRAGRLKAAFSAVDVTGMAETWLLAAKLVFAVAGCGAGIRLARLARRPSGVPVHTWASTTIFVGGVGLLGFGLGPSLAEHSLALARWVMLISDAVERVAMLMLAVFVWRVYGAGAPARAILLSATLVGMTASWTYVLLVQRWPEPLLHPQVQAASQLAFAAPFLWATLEAWLERRRSRRQLALGLGDPAACHRSLLWALGCGGFGVSCLAAACAAFLPGGTLDEVLTGLRAALYTAVSVVVALAFFPPSGYTRWVAGGGPGAAGREAPRGGLVRRAALAAARGPAPARGRPAPLVVREAV